MGPKKSKFRTQQKVLDFIFSSKRPFPAVRSPTTPLLTSTPGESDEKVQLAINEEKHNSHLSTNILLLQVSLPSDKDSEPANLQFWETAKSFQQGN